VLATEALSWDTADRWRLEPFVNSREASSDPVDRRLVGPLLALLTVSSALTPVGWREVDGRNPSSRTFSRNWNFSCTAYSQIHVNNSSSKLMKHIKGDCSRNSPKTYVLTKCLQLAVVCALMANLQLSLCFCSTLCYCQLVPKLLHLTLHPQLRIVKQTLCWMTLLLAHSCGDRQCLHSTNCTDTGKRLLMQLST
jgi:hypothetical protein